MRRRRAMWSALICLAGCSAWLTPAEEQYDSKAAVETLNTALEAWKAGKVKTLTALESPIRFVDDDFRAGFRLLDFAIVPPSQPVRPFQSVSVTLTLTKGKGEPITRAATYQISLEPRRAVLRSDT